MVPVQWPETPGGTMPRDDRQTHTTEPQSGTSAAPRQDRRSATKPEFCNETCSPGTGCNATVPIATDARALSAAEVEVPLTCTDALVTTDNRALCEPTLSGLEPSPQVTKDQGKDSTTSQPLVIPTESPSEPGSRPKAVIRDRPRYASVVVRFHRGAVSVEGILDQPRKGVVGVCDLCDTADSRSDSRLSRLRNLGRKPGACVAHGSTFFPIRKSVTAW